MHNKYNEYVEKQHAPRELVQDTMEQMKQMQGKPSYITKYQWGKFVAAVACACGIFILGGHILIGQKVTYYNMDGMEIVENFGNAATAKKSISVEEYDSMIGTKMVNMKKMSDWNVTNEESFVSYEDGLTWGSEEQEIVSDGCRISLEKDGAKAAVQVSKNNAIAPSELLQKKENRISGMEIYLGYDKEQKMYYGAFTENDCSYVVQCKGLSKKEMTAFLKEILKVIK